MRKKSWGWSTMRKRKQTQYKRESSVQERELKQERLDSQKKQVERALAHQNLMFQQHQEILKKLQDQLRSW